MLEGVNIRPSGKLIDKFKASGGMHDLLDGGNAYLILTTDVLLIDRYSLWSFAHGFKRRNAQKSTSEAWFYDWEFKERAEEAEKP